MHQSTHRTHPTTSALRRLAVAAAGGLAGALVLTSAAAAGAGLAPAAAAQAAPGTGEGPVGPGPQTWTVTAQAFDVITGPNDDIAVTIDADLWLPDNATTATPAPAVLTTHGFGNAKDSPEQRANAALFASHGYVVLSYSSLGFGGSGGCIGLNSLDHDVKVAVQLIDWLAAQDFVAQEAPGDPRVGMVGGSYGGGQQGLTAITDPRLDAIVPGRTWNALQYSLVPNNWIADPATPWDMDNYEQGVFKQEWTSLFYGYGTAQPAQGLGGCDPASQQAMFPGAAPCPGFIPEVCPIYARLSATGEATEEGRATVRRASIGTFVDQLTTPTLLVQGLPDTLFVPAEVTATFLDLQSRGVEVAMIWHSGGHGGYQAGPGEAEAYGGIWDDSPQMQAQFGRAYLPRRTLAWFERHVRGLDVETGPAFTWFRDWIDVDLDASAGSAAAAFDAAPTYPPFAATTLVLDPGASALVAADDQAGFVGGTATLLNPAGGEPGAYSETANFSSPGQPGDRPTTEVEGQFAAFDSAPMAVDTEVVGIGTGTLHLGHLNPAQDVTLFAKLYEVATDGTARLLRRQVSPSRIPSAVIDAGAVTVRFPAAVERIEAGNRLRVVLATTDLAYYNARLADTVTLTSTADAPSTVTIPMRPVTAAATTGPPADPPSDTAPAPSDLPATGGGAAVGAVLALAAVGRRRRLRGR